MKPLRHSLVDGVHESLTSRLFSGDIAPGSSLNIDALARELEVSQTPIREALARLAATGLVVRVAHMGYRAAELVSDEQMSEILDARLAVEPTLARLAAGRTTASFLDELDRSVRSLEARIAGELSQSSNEVLEQSEDFHNLIATQSGNRFLSNAHGTITGHSRRFQLMGVAGRSDHVEVFHEHGLILDALRGADPDRAEAAMRCHIQAIRERTLQDLGAISEPECAS